MSDIKTTKAPTIASALDQVGLSLRHHQYGEAIDPSDLTDEAAAEIARIECMPALAGDWEVYWTSDDGQTDMLTGEGATPDEAASDAKEQLQKAVADGNMDSTGSLGKPQESDALKARILAASDDDSDISAE